VDVQPATSEIDLEPSPELLEVERGAPGDEQVDLDLGVLMDQVRAAFLAHRPGERVLVDIELTLETGDDSGDVPRIDRGNDVDVECRPGLAGERARDGPANV
jgi:hypothetical protein